MVSYRYLGSALTNANGVATFDYQGTGAGEIDVIASLDKPIVDGSIVSETYEVLDCAFYDKATNGTGEKNTYWVNQNNCMSVELTSDGTKLTRSSNGNYLPSSVANSTNWDNRRSFPVNCKIEFHVVEKGANWRLRIYDDSNISTLSTNVLGTGDYVIEITDTQIKVNNDAPISISNISNILMSINSSGDTSGDFIFKDLKIYPI